MQTEEAKMQVAQACRIDDRRGSVGRGLQFHRWGLIGVMTWSLVGLALGLMGAGDASAQIQGIRRPGVIRLGGPGLIEPAGYSADDEEQIEIDQGGTVKTDPDLESIMKKAERYRKDGNFRVAAQLWQAVLERSGDSLFSSDGQTYYSMVQQVEEVIAELPPEGLAMYRVTADAKAQELLAQAGNPNDVSALSNIVRQYFLSSEGDDAAFRLGCIYLDDYDFNGARRLFRKIVDQYPDPSVSVAEVQARIALCETFLGDFESARKAIEVATTLDPRNRPAKTVLATVEKVESGDNPLSGSMNNRSKILQWLMPMGNASRQGVGPAVPAEVMSQDLVAVWQYSFPPRDRFSRAADTVGRVAVGNQAHDQKFLDDQLDSKEKLIRKKWQDKVWRPTGHLLFQGDHVVFKTGADLVSWSRSKIVNGIEKSRQELDGAPAGSGQTDANQNPADKNATAGSEFAVADFVNWRSVQRNIFEVDNATMISQWILKNYGEQARLRRGIPDTPGPYRASEVQLFGDGVFSQMSIHQGTLFSIEGEPYDTVYSRVAKGVSHDLNQSYRRSRSNKLVAYDAESGLFQWRLPRSGQPQKEGVVFGEGEEPEWIEDGGFMAAPVGFEDLVIAPVNKGGTIWVYGFDASQQGKTVWKSYLCDEPESGAVSWSSIDLSIDGSDLFVTCGLGAMFVLDPATGTVRVAKRYPRTGVIDGFYRRRSWSVKRAAFSGWSSDVVIPHGRQAIRFSSDTQIIEAIDRNDGSVIWRSEMNPIGYKVDYLLGVYNDVLYAAGKETIVAYDLNGEGRMTWGADQLFDGALSLGRGWLTPEGIYMPVQDKIIQFDLAGKNGAAKVLAKVHVDLGGAPVGNLYSDGERFWVHNGNRLYVLGAKSE